MYTAGHEHILQEALKRMNNLDMLDKHNLSILKDGLKYPDFPCGKYGIDATRSQLTFERKVCSVLGLLTDLNNVFASAFSSHNGYFSVWHAMTYNPARPVYKINNDILDQIMGFLSLACNSEGSDQYFWLGMALHTIMDSYSPAHVLRSGGQDQDMQAIIDRVKQHPVKHDATTVKFNAILRDLKDALLPVAKVIESEDAPEIEAIVQKIVQTHNVPKRQLEHIRALAMFLYFYNHHQLKTKEWFADQTPRRKSKAQRHVDKLINAAQVRPIITYLFYPQQSSLFHKIHDTLRAARAQGLEELAIADTATILGLFLKRNPRNPHVFLNAAHHYLAHVTFTIADGAENLETGVANSYWTAGFRAHTVVS